MRCWINVFGDFNLNYEKINDDNYSHNFLFQDFEDVLSTSNFVQIVNFVTWSRMVGIERKTSVLDHIYVKDPTIITNLKCIEPFFGEHLLVEFCANVSKSKNVPIKSRDWPNYSKDLFNVKLSSVDWKINIDDEQQYWNVFGKFKAN